MASIPADKIDDKRLFSESDDSSSNRPSPEKLNHVYKTLADNLPNFFTHSLDYSVYHENIIFEDHLRNIRTV